MAVISETAPILIAGQAQGLRVHESGLPFNDASGDRLRDWLQVSREQLRSQGKNTPFLGLELPGKVRYTLVEGQVMFGG